VIRKIDGGECRRTLKKARFGRLACSRGDQPYVVPVYFEIAGQYLYSFATLGQKIEWMRENPLVCVEVDSVASSSDWSSVLAFGRYEELPPRPEFEDVRRIAEQLLQRRPVWWEPASAPSTSGEQRTPVIYRVRLDCLTGLRASPDGAEEARVAAKGRGWLGTLLRSMWSGGWGPVEPRARRFVEGQHPRRSL
jgi:nitroimidazol reductase NimA-like FMN-containing flavoprotein (pyridoxamine 5'-phosphate oxidase superfamily)